MSAPTGDFLRGWFERAASTAERQGRKDSAALWRDGLAHILVLEQTVADLRAELAAAQPDAERYRWLRHRMNSGETVALPMGVKLDRAIDAAIAARKGAG